MSGQEYKAFLEGEHKVFEIGNRRRGCWQRITYNKWSFFFTKQEVSSIKKEHFLHF